MKLVYGKRCKKFCESVKSKLRWWELRKCSGVVIPVGVPV